MRQRYSTDIENILRIALEKEKINFCEQFPIRGKYSYQLDFAIVNLKIDIEADGKHWHKKGNTHDRKRNWALRNQGWKILRFTCDEIKKDMPMIINKIQDNIKRREEEKDDKNKS